MRRPGIALVAVLVLTDQSRIGVQLAMLPLLIWKWRRTAPLREARRRHATALKAGR